jgi:hypothetical protein
VMMGHALPYYRARIEATGYTKARDLLAYRIGSDFELPRAMTALTSKSATRVRLRPMRKSNMAEDLRILRDLFNDAWSGNWGFIPFTEAEFTDIGKLLAHLVDEDFVQIAEVDDEPAGMIVALPNINEVIRDLNGHLFPLGWAKLLWRLKWRYPRSGRVTLMGIRKAHHRTLLGTAIAYMLINALRAPVTGRGIREVEMSWILEQNMPMRHIIESLGGTVYKRYRLYGKDLA